MKQRTWVGLGTSFRWVLIGGVGLGLAGGVAYGQVQNCITRYAQHAAGWSDSLRATGPGDGLCASTSQKDLPLDVTRFEFSLPPGGTVASIEVRVKAGREKSAPMGARLVLDGVEVTGLVKWTPAADTALPPCSISEWAFLPAQDELGDALWGRLWTAGEINRSTFGVRIYSGPEADLRAVDAVEVTVCYLIPSGYAISTGPGVRILLDPFETRTDSSSWITYSAGALGPNGTEIAVHVDSIPYGLTLRLYPSDLSLEDSSPYSAANPLNLATARGPGNAKALIVLGGTGDGKRATLNYVAMASPELPAGPLPPVRVTFTIRDRP